MSAARLRAVDAPRNPPLLAALREDAAELAKVKGSGRRGWLGTLDVLSLPGFWTVVLWRVANALHERHLRPLSRLAYAANMVLHGADLPAGAVIAPGLVIPHPVGVTIASDVVIGRRCRLMSGVAIGGSGRPGLSGHPVLGDDVWLLHRCAVLGPVRIGDRAVIGAGTIVSRDVESEMLVLIARASAELRVVPRRDLAEEPAAEAS